MFFVIGFLYGAAAVHFAQRVFHAFGFPVGIQHHLSANVARGAARNLYQRGGVAQEAFVIRSQNGHQPHLRNIYPFAQQINAHQHVKYALAELL